MSNSIKDLLASVKCCLSADIYQKDKLIRYGSMRTDIMYSSIISRIIYNILSDIQTYTNDVQDDGIYGLYYPIYISTNGIENITDGIYLIIDEDNLNYYNNDVLISVPYTLDGNDIIVGDLTGIFYADVFVVTGTAYDGYQYDIFVKDGTQSVPCFSKEDVCEMYDFLNKKCKSC